VTRTLLALLVFLAPAGTGSGRDGLDRLHAGDAAGAEERFRAAIAAAEDADSPAAAALLAASWVGVGLARLEQDDPAGAASAFDEAARWTSDDSAAALALYDAGTALARAERWDEARDRLQRALMLRPEYTDARHNLEVVLRRLQGPPPAGGRPPEPSEFARRLRARADSLVALRRYGDALRLLQDGLARDSTVAAFSDVIQRLDAVVGIVDSTTGPAPR
jgi:tetratricopeptide (TPR) repeat protein